jgi:uncharacterized protein (TIGR03437 family)
MAGILLKILAGRVDLNHRTPAPETGEIIELFATGFGATLASGELLALTPTIAIDGIAAVSFAGLVGPGLYQLNVAVPSRVTLAHDALVMGLSGDFKTQPNAFLTITAHQRLKRLPGAKML